MTASGALLSLATVLLVPTAVAHQNWRNGGGIVSADRYRVVRNVLFALIVTLASVGASLHVGGF